VVYDKGAYVLHMLRGLAGDDAFRDGLRTLQQTHRFRKAGTAELRSALEAASGRDLGPYFQEWVFGTTLPRLRVAHRTQGDDARTVEVEVKAEGLPGAVPLQISVRHQSGTTRTRVELPREGGRFTIEAPSRARGVSINDDAGLLARIEG
jgi:aminopeptidase N